MKKESLGKAVELVETPIESLEQERRGIGLSLKSVGVSFSGVQALKNISFEILPGERVGVIGNNGAGKSTLCDVISGLTNPTEGTVEIDQIDATKKSTIWRAKKGMRRVFQHPVYYEDLSLVENVMIGSPPSRGDGIISALLFPRMFHKEQRDTAIRIMEYCNIVENESHSATNLPYATKKRLELARALMGNPRILVLDEPAASMDEEERAQYCQVVLDYVETFSTTLIVVEHDVEIIKTLCNRAIAVDAGEVIADGEVIPVLRNDKVINLYLGTKGAK